MDAQHETDDSADPILTMTNVRESQLSAGFAGKGRNRGALNHRAYGFTFLHNIAISPPHNIQKAFQDTCHPHEVIQVIQIHFWTN